MHNPINARAPSFDANAINDTIQRALACAGLDTSAGPMHEVTETIRRAFASAGLVDSTRPPVSTDSVIDVVARVVDAGGVADIEPQPWPSGGKAETPGTFETWDFSNKAGARAYKLYVPARVSQLPRPIVVMLHGCTQSADDFAVGTRMNRLADEHDFLVVYPEQPARANSSKCWNWFKQQDQLRDAGEPSLIAGIVREVTVRHGADPRRVFVAGLSAGAAMAVVLGETYPELFAGVGAHSGLPYGSAYDIPSAMAAMKGGRSGLPGLKGMPAGAAGSPKKAVQPVPLIVFHGDRDHTVQQTNGKEIVKQARDAHAAKAGQDALNSSTQCGKAPGGRSYSRTVHADGTGQAHIEFWTLQGAGHAWSGGDARGSYTDRTGPDASAEMVRFFLALPRAGSA
ncbi:MAG: PHB depolymerase family esterase [Cytophagales bacterium]|nr:PHB depolymerase family esterase [Rhizobacter sp.]